MTQELQSTAGSVGTPYMPEFSVFSKLEATYEEIAHALNGLSYDSIYFPHIVSVALLNNCLEAALAMVFLSRAPTDGGHPVLLRTLLESTARLMFLARSPEDNALILERIDCTEILRQIGKSANQGEPEETAVIRKIITDRLAVLNAEKIRKVSFKDILAEIKSTSLYPIYQTLSGVTHGQITPLLQQGFVEEPTTGSKFKILRRLPEEKRQGFQEMAIGLLQLARLNMQRIFRHYPDAQPGSRGDAPR